MLSLTDCCKSRLFTPANLFARTILPSVDVRGVFPALQVRTGCDAGPPQHHDCRCVSQTSTHSLQQQWLAQRMFAGAFLAQMHVQMTPSSAHRPALFLLHETGLQQQGKTAVCAAVDGQIRAVFGIADAVRPESKQVSPVHVWPASAATTMLWSDNAVVSQRAHSIVLPSNRRYATRIAVWL